MLRPLVAAAFAALALLAGPLLAGPQFAEAADKQKVVYHLADEDKVRFALNNIRNHIEGAGGPEAVEIVLVVHGPALKGFHDLMAEEPVPAWVTALQADGVAMNACGNTMRVQGVELDDLLPGFVRVDQGGVVRIAELQQQGYLYLRP